MPPRPPDDDPLTVKRLWLTLCGLLPDPYDRRLADLGGRVRGWVLSRLTFQGVWPLALLLAVPAGAAAQTPPGWLPHATRLRLQVRRPLTADELAACKAADDAALAAYREAHAPPPAPPPLALPCPARLARLDPNARAAWEACTPAVAEQLGLFAAGPQFESLGDQAGVFWRLVAAHGDPAARYLTEAAWHLRDDRVRWEGVSADPGRYFASAPRTAAPAPPPTAQAPPGPALWETPVWGLPAWQLALGAAGLVWLSRPGKKEEPPSW